MSESPHHPKPLDSDSHGHAFSFRAGQRRRLMGVLILTLVTMIGEFVGGILTRSIALTTDAVHMLTHFLTIGMTFMAAVIAERPAPPDKTYRYWRVEVIASLVSGIMLIPVAGYVVYEAVYRWQNPVEIKVGAMLWVGAIGLLVNIVSAALLHHHSKHNLNVRGAFLHMIADTASSVGVIVAGGIVAFTGWKQADPVAAGIISAMVLYWAAGLIRESGSILLESAPRHMNLEEIRAAMRDFEDVREVHDLHVWTITSRMYALTAHVRLNRDLKVSETDALGRKLREMLDQRYEINHATLMFEMGDDTPEG